MKSTYSTNKIISALQNREKIKEFRFYKGDFSASDLLIDLEIIMDNCNLTDKQAFVVEKHFVQGYTQDEVAAMLGVTQQMVEKHCRVVKKKIEKVLTRWGHEN